MTLILESQTIPSQGAKFFTRTVGVKNLTPSLGLLNGPESENRFFQKKLEDDFEKTRRKKTFFWKVEITMTTMHRERALMRRKD